MHEIINSNIHTTIKQGLKNSVCLVSMENLDFKYHPEVNDDYLSPSTAKRDQAEKKDIYEKAGVAEYWIVSPQDSVEIYYLETRRHHGAYSYY